MIIGCNVSTHKLHVRSHEITMTSEDKEMWKITVENEHERMVKIKFGHKLAETKFINTTKN
jgi:hypothetical protein